MAFLNHAIPWSTVSTILEYTDGRKQSRPRSAGVVFNTDVNRVKQLEYFARKFRDVVQEHSVIERHRHRSPEEYAHRAEGWQTSNAHESKPSPIDGLQRPEHPTGQERTLKGQRNEELLQTPANSADSAWSTSPECRPVYSQDFINEYLRAPNRPEVRKWHTKILEDGIGQQIQDWILLSQEEIPQRRPDDMCTDFAFNDVVKLLITDVVLTAHAEQYRYKMDTLLLIAHHPQINMKGFTSLYMDCCNINIGFDMIAVMAVKMFLFFNIMVSAQDLGMKEISQPKETAVVFERNKEFQLSTKAHWSFGGKLDYTELLPRPGYMNTRLWNRLLIELYHEHQNQAEKVIFGMILFPLREDGTTVEVDLLSDPNLLKAHLKTLWKIIFVVNMIMREIGKPFNWEYGVLQTLNDLFGWPSDEYFYEYEDRRRGWGLPEAQRTLEMRDFYLHMDA